MPLPCNVVKLVDVEEMNYFSSNGEGEVSFWSIVRETFSSGGKKWMDCLISVSCRCASRG